MLFARFTHSEKINAVTGETLSYTEILQQSLKVAHQLKNYHIGKGSIVAVISENRIEFPMVSFAAFFRNATIVPINPNYTAFELNHVLELIEPQVIFASEKPMKTLHSIISQHSYIRLCISIDNQTPPKDWINISDWFKETNYSKESPGPVILPNDVTLMVLSSGTTGLPKAVQLTHHNVMTVIAYMREDPRYTQLSVPIRMLGILPFYHVYGFMLTLNVCCNKYPMVVLPRFEPDLFLRSIQDYRVTMANLVPPLVVFLAKHPAVDRYDLRSLQTILSGAAPLSREVEEQVLKRLPHVQSIRTAYGMSESSLGVISRVNDKAGSVGRVHKTSWIKVMHVASGKTLGPYEVGEICIKGPLVMKGYYRNEEATKLAIDVEGWLHSGDIGYFDDEGDFFIVDRIKDLIKYKGFQVAPAEVEDVLLSHPGIKDAAVVGLADADCGELPAAFVVPQDGFPLTENEVKGFVASKLSPQKQLRGGVYFVREIPKTGSGKILRRELRSFAARQTKAKL
ncbi:uncharacterized protein LOC129733475 isoform X2 [Wyeomyia smithii]|uniref:uncharacterized protein LOC129731855 isoform X2 n=1 Tax=Wyeomyia smithii TaxID=174621 RepID=UPI002467E2F3|nr:uncharacterized protein LOC129731855 isoform X2 [Wyeomyia smithii]XP_055551191.1 uncharacterized protein LOC129733475 isoform X2 [Wyeomyia smithii]